MVIGFNQYHIRLSIIYHPLAHTNHKHSHSHIPNAMPNKLNQYNIRINNDRQGGSEVPVAEHFLGGGRKKPKKQLVVGGGRAGVGAGHS